MSKHNDVIMAISKRRGLLIIITAAILLELLSGAQYYFTRNLMDEELEKRAESELTLKAILTKSMLNDAEDVLSNHLWDIRVHLQHPDSVYSSLGRLITQGQHLLGCGVGFVPSYFPSEGRLYEPYSRLMDDGTISCRQLASDSHDYTNSQIWQKALTTNHPIWVEPYVDEYGTKEVVTSYCQVLRDFTDSIAGVVAIDISLDGLRDTIDRRHIYPSSFLLLLTEGGQPIIQPSEAHVSRETVADIISLINDSTVARHKSRSGRSTVIHFDTNERDGTVFCALMKGNPRWQLAVVCYDDEVYAPLSRLRIWLLLLMLVAFGILLYMVARYARGERELHKKTLEQERMSSELRIANGIQQALLPDNEPTLTGISDISVEGRLLPAKAVGGDLYNAFVRDGKLFFCIGDVSGKGIPAALIMAISQTLFRDIASREDSPERIMEHLNLAACRNNKSNVFVTMFIGVLDLPTGHLRYCNAGHELPVVVKDARSTENSEDGDSPDNAKRGKMEVTLLEAIPNIPIGLFDDFQYVKQETEMQPFSTLFLYTDGLTEARNARYEMFGMERVLTMIADSGTTQPKQLVDSVIAKVQQFADVEEQSDDMTMMAISYTPSEQHLILDESLTLHNNVKEVATLSTFVKDVMARLNIAKPLASKLRLAVEEAVVNVMEYAYVGNATGDVNIRVTCDGQHLRCIITDSGIPFNPTEVTAADTTLTVEERPVGGLGILLVRQLMDTVNYERTDGKNVLTLTKLIHNT